MAKRKKAKSKSVKRKPDAAKAKAPQALDADQLLAVAQIEAVIVEVAAGPLDDGLPRDTLVGPPKVLVEEEHRTLPRVTLEVDVDLSSESHFFTGLSGDISEGGVFVSTYRNVDVGSEVDTEFSLPNGAVQTRGLVRWHRDASPYGPPGIGIEFDLLSEDERRMIHDFCAARAPLYYEVDQL